MEKERKIARFIGGRYFSNKKYGIRVALFDHGMARASMIYKKRRVDPWHCGEHQMAEDKLCFDECKYEAVWDYFECLNYLRESKVARKWFRKTLQPCLEPFVLPNGEISTKLAMEYDMESRGNWWGYFDKIDNRLFDREDIFADERVYDFNITFWNKEDYLKCIDLKSQEPQRFRRFALPLYVHCDLERLKEISQMVVPDVYNRLVEKYGADKIEDIHLRVLHSSLEEEDRKKHVRITKGEYSFHLPSVANFWEIPKDYDDEVERIISKW